MLTERDFIIKNLFALNISLLLTFSTLYCTTLIQVNLYNNENIGLVSQTVNFGISILTSLVIPSIICKLFRLKWSLMIAELCLFSYVAIQIYPRWQTLIPSSN